VDNHILHRVAEYLRKSRYAVALTGAGISVESGIPDFRSEDGLWSRYDPMEYGTIDAFLRNPGKVWKMLREMDEVLGRAEPNPAHRALSDLEKRNIVKAIITQNIDSLHQRAGSRNVMEFHGHNRSLRCERCRRRFERREVSLAGIPPLCPCGGPLRPELVFFGEVIPPAVHDRAIEAALECDVMLVVGTSATVAPASLLPRTARRHGAVIIEVNPHETELTRMFSDLHVAAPAGKALPAIVAALDDRFEPVKANGE